MCVFFTVFLGKREWKIQNRLSLKGLGQGGLIFLSQLKCLSVLIVDYWTISKTAENSSVTTFVSVYLELLSLCLRWTENTALTTFALIRFSFIRSLPNRQLSTYCFCTLFSFIVLQTSGTLQKELRLLPQPKGDKLISISTPRFPLSFLVIDVD